MVVRVLYWYNNVEGADYWSLIAAFLRDLADNEPPVSYEKNVSLFLLQPHWIR